MNLLHAILTIIFQHIAAYADAAPTISVNPSLGLTHITQGSQVLNSNPSGIDTVISDVLLFVFSIAGLVAFIFIIIAGFTYLTGGGDQNSIEKSKKTLTNAIIGLVIVLFSYFLTHLLLSFFGLGNSGAAQGFNNLFNSV